MLNKELTLVKMLEHFPKWMDIRKRAKSSIGGKLLESVAEETALIQDAIDDYKKDFFIESYFGKEEDIVSYVYRIQVGEVDINTITIESHTLKSTLDIKEFYGTAGLFYYENGYLFFRAEDIKQDEEVHYKINNYLFNARPEIYHVWNIFDEFATFVGLERHMYESNQSLENRILNVFRDKMNSSEEGLKHAILTELMELSPDIILDDIIIEGVTPNNLRKKYEEFDTVLEAIANVNRDAYQYKRWDIDPWYYSLKSIDYIPHAWDVALEAFKDGIGKTDDLSVMLSTPNDTTDATVMFYAKNRDQIQSFIETSKINTDLQLNLTRFNNQLKPIQAKYKITAAQAYDITDKSISFEYSDVGYFDENVYIEDYISGLEALDQETIQVIDETTLPANKTFKIMFEPTDSISLLEVEECSITRNGIKESLLIADKNFDVSNSSAYYKYAKIYANKIKHFESTKNIEDAKGGLQIKTNAGTSGELVLNLDDMQNQNIFFKYFCRKASLLDAFETSFSLQNFRRVDSYFESYEEPGETKMNFTTRCNSLSFKAFGKCYINIYNALGEQIQDTTFVTDQFHFTLSPRNKIELYTVEIVSSSNIERVTIKDLEYTKYETKEELGTGSIHVIQGYNTLPNIEKNSVTISMRTEFEYSPILEKVFVGIPYNPIHYRTKEFTTDANTKIRIRSKYLTATLVHVNNGFEDISSSFSKSNFYPHIKYRALVNNATILLDTSRFINIQDISCENAQVKPYESSYYLEIKQGAEVSKVHVAGYSANNIKEIPLTKLFNIKPPEAGYPGDKLYITNLVDGFIVERQEPYTYTDWEKDAELTAYLPIQEKVSLKDITSIRDAFKYGIFTYTNIPAAFNQMFIINYDNNNQNFVYSEKRYHGSIKEVYLKARDSQKYIAYNEQKILQRKRSYISIDDTFSPFLPSNKQMYYDIEVMTNGIQVLFHKEHDSAVNYGNWSVGKKPLCVLADFDIFSSTNYLTETFNLNQSFQLNKLIPIPKSFTTDNGTIINAYHYIIKAPEGYAVDYMTIDPNIMPIESAPEYYGLEMIQKYSDGFNKLEYSNIDEILQFGIGDPNGPDFIPISSSMYDLLDEEGIIVWKPEADSLNLDYEEIYIKYTLKIPNALIVSDDILYEKVDHALDSYTLLKTTELNNISSNALVDYSKDIVFNSSDRIVVICTNPSFDAHSETTGLRFVRTNYDNAFYAKAGYYYIDGVEYYMFANETKDKTDKVMSVKFYNTAKQKDGIHMQKTSNNFINNSLLLLEGMGDIYSKSFVKDNNVKGASSANAITACSSFNHWNTVACELSFAKGKNDMGIKLTPLVRDGYAYINITDKLFKDTRISFYANGNIEAFICREGTNNPSRMIDTNSIVVDDQIQAKPSDASILEHSFKPENGFNYYLAVKGDGLIDDIIICDNTNLSPLWDYHNKNITTLGFSITEQYQEDYVNRMFFYNTGGYKNQGAEIDKTNTVINSSMINWGHTKIREFASADDWTYSELNNVSLENNMVVSKNSKGYILTEPIHIGDTRMLKSLSLKINDIEFDQMSNLVSTVLSSDDYYGTYEVKASFRRSVGVIQEREINKLKKYIRIKIDMPADKVVHKLSLFSEYKESKEITPVEKINSNGIITSEIYDAQYTTKYKLMDINIKKISNREDVRLQIRAARTDKEDNVWTSWKEIELDESLKIKNEIIFDQYKYFQFRISLKRRDAFIQIDYFDLKVVK